MSRLNTTAWNRIRYSFYAPVYDIIGRPLQPYRRRAITLLAPNSGARILLVGAGTGLDLEHLSSRQKIVATDIAPPMVDRIRRRAAQSGKIVDCRVMDGQHLDFPDASFDFAVCHLILAVIPDPVACIREVARVLVPGGRVSVFDKFVRPGERASIVRRMLNPVSAFLFSEINRSLEPLLDSAGLIKVSDEPAILNGLFRIAIAEKPGRADGIKEEKELLSTVTTMRMK